MNTYKLLIAYDGTHYGGWQVQPNTNSIQQCIQNALKILLKAPHALSGSGRTDAGVHALGQVAHFSTSHLLDPFSFLYKINALLPKDIRILSMEKVSAEFHARYSATGKVYHYHLHLGPTMDPFERLYKTHLLHKIDLSLLQKAARQFVGTHDFTSFANEAHLGSASKDPIRTIRRLDLVEQKGGVRLEFEADGFLYKMVRNIVGTLLEVGKGSFSLEEIPPLFSAKDRSRAGQTAPPQGLFLMQVHYS